MFFAFTGARSIAKVTMKDRLNNVQYRTRNENQKQKVQIVQHGKLVSALKYLICTRRMTANDHREYEKVN